MEDHSVSSGSSGGMPNELYNAYLEEFNNNAEILENQIKKEHPQDKKMIASTRVALDNLKETYKKLNEFSEFKDNREAVINRMNKIMISMPKDDKRIKSMPEEDKSTHKRDFFNVKKQLTNLQDKFANLQNKFRPSSGKEVESSRVNPEPQKTFYEDLVDIIKPKEQEDPRNFSINGKQEGMSYEIKPSAIYKDTFSLVIKKNDEEENFDIVVKENTASVYKFIDDKWVRLVTMSDEYLLGGPDPVKTLFTNCLEKSRWKPIEGEKNTPTILEGVEKKFIPTNIILYVLKESNIKTDKFNIEIKALSDKEAIIDVADNEGEKYQFELSFDIANNKFDIGGMRHPLYLNKENLIIGIEQAIKKMKNE